MSTDERIRIIIDALNQSERDLNRLKTDLRDVEVAGHGASGGISPLISSLKTLGVVAASAKVAQIGYELGVAGAEAQRLDRAFGTMAGGAYESEKMMRALQEATLYTKTEIELMSGATKILALELASDADELARIVRNVDFLGGMFGGTLQSFQLMVTNQSKMRLDEFGLSIEDVTRRIDAYTRAGRSAEDAFRMAVLDAMDEKFEALGGTIDDNAASVERMTAAWVDLKTEVGKLLADVVGTGTGTLGGWLRQTADDIGRLNDMLERFDKVPLQGLRLLNIALGGWDPGLQSKLKQAGLELDAIAMGFEAMSQGATDVGASLGMVVPRIAQTTTETESLTRATVNYRDELNHVNMLMRDDWTRAQERYQQSIRSIDADLAETQAQLAEYQALHGQVMDTERDRAEILRELTVVEERARLAQERLNLAASEAPDFNLDGLRAAAREASSELRSIESQLKSMQAGTFYGPDDYLRYLQDVFRYEQLLDQQAEALERQAEAEAALAPAEETYAAAQAREAEIRAQEQQLRLEEQLYGLQKQREALLDELNNPQRYDYTEEISTMEQRERELHERRLQAIEERVTAERQAALKILEARILEGGVTPGEVEVYRAMAERYGMLDPATMSLIRQADQLLGRGFQRAPFLPSAGGPQMTPAPAPTGSTLNLYGDLVVQGSNVGDILSQVQRMVP